jgi:branched-chain amino acid transport system ATP-binding protein
MVLLEGKSVSINFGGVKALSNVDFHVNQGEVLGLIGPNGAGKTTLLNAISGLCHRSGGSLQFKGQDISHLKPHQIAKLGIARTFQVVKPFERLTVLENVAMGAMFSSKSGLSKDEILHRAEVASKSVGISEKALLYPRQLTLSERQQLELARALAMNPDLLLLDEVMAGLNHSEIDKTIALIRHINEALGMTILVVEHVMKAIMNVCHRVVVLQFGKKIADGSPQEVVDTPEVIQAYLGQKFAARHLGRTAERTTSQ